MKDRLAWFCHAGDTECLEQAYKVAKHQRVDVQEIERWAVGEGKEKDYSELKNTLISTQE